MDYEKAEKNFYEKLISEIKNYGTDSRKSNKNHFYF